MSHESRVTSHELAKEVAGELVATYSGNVTMEDISGRFCKRPKDQYFLLSSILKKDAVWGDWMTLEVLDFRSPEDHLLNPIEWLRGADSERFKQLGETGLSLFQVELQIAVSSGPRQDIRFDQWMPKMLTPEGQIIKDMIVT